MLKKMQRRFILAAMAAFGTVMVVWLVGINLVNYYRTTSMRDEMAEELLRREQRAFRRPGAALPPMADMPGGGPEAEFTTRFLLPIVTRRGISYSYRGTIFPPSMRSWPGNIRRQSC
ncbi:MAG: hypothetical protein HFH95_01055 [Lachnospiraceae bacterium]|nr:hypothetical protein [uncultured Acetatifactor sp.]MCI8541906.1 hypothetical protein [Lachnospiraceae bacterium]